MYKTIRHGENSLQYTILPQNDDFRIEGKLTSAESSCSSTSRKPKRPKRRSFFAYLGLIFVCTVIVGAVLIPFLVSAECLPNPTEWFLAKKTQTHDRSVSSSKSHDKVVHSNVRSSLVGNGINIGKTVKIINQSGVEKLILRVNKTNNATAIASSQANANAYLKNNNHSNENIIDRKKFDAGNSMAAIGAQVLEQNDFKNAQNGKENVNIQTSLPAGETIQAQSARKIQFEGNVARKPIYDEQNQIEHSKNDQQADQQLVSEVRFDPIETASLSAPMKYAPTIVVTTLRNTIDSNVNSASQQQQIYNAQVMTTPNARPTMALSSPTIAIGRSSSLNASQPNINSIVPTPSSTLMTRIMQVPLLKATARKPIIPPVLVKTNSQSSTTNGFETKINKDISQIVLPTSSSTSLLQQSVINSKTPEDSSKIQSARTADWIHGHWPFIDPSTYFQWTGYKGEDSVLLPALLGFALIGMILIITVCLVARNKRTIVSSVRKRNRNITDVEENGSDDNATLLTTNLSDED